MFKNLFEFGIAFVLLFFGTPQIVELWDNHLSQFDSHKLEQTIRELSGGRSQIITTRSVAVPPGADKNQVVKAAKTFLYVPYYRGGNNKNGIDCSGLTCRAFKEAGISIPRTVARQFRVGTPIKNMKNLKVGDLIFFATGWTHKASHVGIYVGDNKMIHASSGFRKVICVPINNAYYRSRFLGGRRIIP